MSKLRLLLWDDCPRNCPGCCNHDWDLQSLPVCRNFSPYEIIMLTGGEPLLKPALVHAVIRQIRRRSHAEVYVYTAMVSDLPAALGIVAAADGICVTLHEQADVEPFLAFADKVGPINRSLRVNVFAGVTIGPIPAGWIPKRNVTWIPQCPLPTGEVFMRLPATIRNTP